MGTLECCLRALVGLSTCGHFRPDEDNETSLSFFRSNHLPCFPHIRDC